MRESGGEPGNPLVAWPTGTGKAFGIALFLVDFFKSNPRAKVIVTTPSEELVEQNYKELKELWPSAPAGIFCAGLGRKDVQYPITFATIDSLDGSQHLFGKVDLLMPDECHRISSKEDTRYHRVYTYFKNKNKYFFMVGWTATDYRMGQGKLTDEGGLFTEVIYDATTMEAFNWFFKQGYLIPPIAAPTESRVSGEKMSMVGGDFKQSDLQNSFEKERESGVIERALREAVAVAREENRTSWIAFVPGIDACEEVVDILETLGVSATCVHSKIKKGERRQRLKDYKDGKYTCMVNNGILTTGFNHKPLDFMIMLRKTASASLWVQMLGRGTRAYYADGFDLTDFDQRWQAIRANGKLNFRVMDFVGNTERLGPINDPKKPKPPGLKKNSDCPVKICDACSAYNHPSVRECFYCGCPFPIRENVDEVASTAPLVKENKKTTPITEWFDVSKVTYKANYRTKRPTIVATYYFQNGGMIDEFICLEHDGPARRRAERWWRERSIHGEQVPDNVLLAMPLVEQLKCPRRLLVWTNTKPREIKNYEY